MIEYVLWTWVMCALINVFVIGFVVIQSEKPNTDGIGGVLLGVCVFGPVATVLILGAFIGGITKGMRG